MPMVIRSPQRPARPRITWAILTGEYPPRLGGVSDYTRLVARGLAAAGDRVHVWCGSEAAATPVDAGVAVHRLPDLFGPCGLIRLGAELDRLPGPYRLLVQYVPHAYGYKALNLPFCLWLSARRDPLWVMFHEVAFPWVPGQKWRRQFLALVHRLMATLLVRAAHRLFVSTPGFAHDLRALSRKHPPIRWLPIPSNLTSTPTPAQVARARRCLGVAPDAVVIGHFGSSRVVRPLLTPTLLRLLHADARRVGVIIGRDGDQFAAELRRQHPWLGGRLTATGVLPEADVAAHLTACDLLLQPYPDGLSARRTSTMAGLALGCPIVTNSGVLTESLWQSSGAVLMAPQPDVDALATLAEVALRDSALRRGVGAKAAVLYRERFSVEKVVHALRSEGQAVTR
jgi:glycosyltransferase involved in cell wall biosynthesis